MGIIIVMVINYGDNHGDNLWWWYVWTTWSKFITEKHRCRPKRTPSYGSKPASEDSTLRSLREFRAQQKPVFVFVETKPWRFLKFWGFRWIWTRRSLKSGDFLVDLAYLTNKKGILLRKTDVEAAHVRMWSDKQRWFNEEKHWILKSSA